APELFDIEAIDIKEGIIQASRLPRNRLFVWKDSHRQRDIIVFIGEEQPPLGKFTFCRKLIEFAKQIGVDSVLTFAAMATAMNPTDEPRLICAATTGPLLEEIRSYGLDTLEEGRISGLNGILLAAAHEA